MEYELYKLLLLRNPHEKYGIGEVTPIVMALFTATKELSNSVLYKGLMDTIFMSPFFRRVYQKTPNQPGIIFPHNIGVVQGSQSKHALSAAVFQGILDEANFGDRANQVLNNYNEITRRMTSRFMQGGGHLPGSFWILSSKKETSSFLEEHINQRRDNPNVKIIEAALWEVQAHIKEKWSGVTFPVFAGDSDREPMILVKNEPIPMGIDVSRVIDVPIELADEYEADLLGSLRDTAGISTTSKFKLFRSREQLNNCLILPNLFRSDTIMLSETDDNDRIQNYLNSDFYSVKTKSVPHFIHLDAALGKTGRGGDRFGMAMCHVHSNKEIRRTDFVTGKISTFQELVVMVDFCLGIEARPGQEVAFWKVREFISFLREMGFNLGSINSQYVSRTGNNTYDKRTGMGLITTDGWQCFTGDTKISLTNGTEVPIKDLVGKEFEVYSYDLNDNRIKPGKATNCRVTGKNAKLVKVTLDNGEEIRCTLEHRFLLRDGGYCEARHLATGMSLMPLYRKDDGWGYEKFYEVGTKFWGRTHIKFARMLYPHYKPTRYGQKNQSGHVIHHKDFNKRNNSTENLIFCENNSEHMKYHDTPERRRKTSERLKKWHVEHKEEWRQTVSEAVKKKWETPTPKMLEHTKKFNEAGIAYKRSAEGRLATSLSSSVKQKWRTKEKHNCYKIEITNAMVYEKYIELKTVKKTAEFFGVHREFVRVRMKDGGYVPIFDNKISHEGITAKILFESYLKYLNFNRVASEFKVSKQLIWKRLKDYEPYIEYKSKKGEISYNNHKVSKVEFLEEHGDVYDFEVEEYHNFALTSGVFVHNSKDMQQLLRKQGFEVHSLSVDRTKEPTTSFKKAVMEERVYCPINKILEKELLHLEDTGKHIDHPERYPDGTKGGKDIADAVIGAVWSCMENAHSSQLYSETMLSEMEDFIGDKSDFWSEKNGTFLGALPGRLF
jgi:hypothetical protein